jgi:D-alanyl-D-alanine carboxypeptidase
VPTSLKWGGRAFQFLALPLVLLALLVAMPAQARYAAIVLDAHSGRVLHAENPDSRNYPASLTKMMTLYLLFEALESGKMKLDTPLKVSKRAEGMSPSKLGLKAGETISVQTAIMALVTKSANDAAVVVAENLGGTEIAFAKRMSDKAQDLGMRNTSFRNASGLPNRRQMSTARDIATLAQHLIRDFPQYYGYFSSDAYTFRGKEMKNHNNLLRSYAGTDGIKTGYIRASGFNLAASVERGNHRLIAVVFGGKSAKSRDAQMMSLLDRGFEQLARDDNDGAASQRFAALSRKKMSQPLALPDPPPAKPVPENMASLPRPQELEATVARLDVAPPTAPKAESDSGSDWAGGQTQWSIQVGAYGDIVPARAAAADAVNRIPKLTENTHISIAPYHAGDRLMYRARLIGMSENSAKQACRSLAKRRIPCIAIAPDSSLKGDAKNNSQTANRP